MTLMRLITIRIFITTIALVMGMTAAHAFEPIEPTGTATAGGTNTCTMDAYYAALGDSERAYGTNDCNSSRPKDKCFCNDIGCCGTYQFCPSTYQRLGYTRDQLRDPAIEAEAIRRFTTENYNYLVSRGAGAYIGKTINGVPVTWSGLLGAAHLGGAGGAMKLLTSGGSYNPNDGGSSLVKYLNDFKGFDTMAGAGNHSCGKVTPPPGGFMPEMLCDENIKAQIITLRDARLMYYDEAMHKAVKPPADRQTIANPNCFSDQLSKISSQFSSASSGIIGGVAGFSPITFGGDAGGILQGFFDMGKDSLMNAAQIIPGMKSFQTGMQGVLDNVLKGFNLLPAGGDFPTELCGMMVDAVINFVQCQFPIELPSFDLSLQGIPINLDLPKNCAGQAARENLLQQVGPMLEQGLAQGVQIKAVP